MKIALITFDNFTDLDLILHWDILNRARSIGGMENWSVKILGTKPTHISTLGLPIPTSGMIEEAEDADGVIVTSGKGTRVLLDDRFYLSRIRLNPAKQIIGAQCSGSLVLGALGLIKGKKVSAYPPILPELKKYSVELVNSSLVIDNRLATASSCLAGQYLSKWMIESLAGSAVAQKVMETVSPIGE